MCWSAEVSLITFLSSSAMCCYLWWRNNANDRPISIWIFAFALMQLFEFFMWINMKSHSWVSKLSLVSVLAQPLILSAALLYIGKLQDYTFIKYLLWCVLSISLLKVLYTIYYILTTARNENWLSSKGPNCHLIWYFVKNSDKMPFLTKIDGLYGFALIFALLTLKPFSHGLIYTIIGVVTHALTTVYYGKEMGSMWCWVANIMGFIAILLPNINLYLM